MIGRATRTNTTLRRVTLFIGLILVFISSVPRPSTAIHPQSLDEIVQKRQALQKEAMTCTDPDRRQQIAKELQSLGLAYQKAVTSQAGPGGVNIADEKARQQAVHEALQSQSDDPCYPVLFQKEYARRYVGTDLPWVTCIPLEFRLTWEVEERWIRTDKWPTGIIRYRLEEAYPGYLNLIFDQKKRSEYRSFFFGGPSPQKTERISARLTAVDASGLLAQASGVPDEFKTVGTSDPRDFELTPDALSQGIEFKWDSDVRQSHGQVTMCDIDIVSEAVVQDPFGLIYPIPKGGTVKGRLTLDELRAALSDGKLAKDFDLGYTLDYHQVRLPETYRRSGNLHLEIILNALGDLSVSPNDGFKSEGPDENGDFAPPYKTYILKNGGSIPLQYSVENKSSWIQPSPTAGTLGPGQSAKVTLSIDRSQAAGLPDGTYQDSVRFVNSTNGSGTTARPVELKKEEIQVWRATVTGFEVDDKLKPTLFKDKDGTRKTLHKKMRFDWELVGEFKLRKEKGKWKFDSGRVVSARATPVPDFTPPGIYTCQTVACAGKPPVSTMAGDPIFGQLSGGNIRLSWPPRQPSGCLTCTTSHPAFPKTPYDALFQSNDFTTQIGLEYFPLKNGPAPTVTKRTWLRYAYTFKRLK
jgi:hypothetical protein